MTFKVLPEARDELFDAAFEYERKEFGLGVRFRREVAAVIDRILFDPYLWRQRRGGYRRVNLPVFPYYVAYFIRDYRCCCACDSKSELLEGASATRFLVRRCRSMLLC